MNHVIKRIIATLLAIYIFLVCGEGWEYILIKDDTSYTRIMMHQMYTDEENIDVIFVGSSHVYRSLIPEIMDSKFNAHTFNMGSSSQYMDGSLAVIKEAAKHNEIKTVYLELYFGVAHDAIYKNRTSLTSTYILSDYMPLSLNKIQYLIHASSNEHWINSFFIARRNWKDFFDSNYVKDVISSKRQKAYKNYEYPKFDDAMEYYSDRGFVANNTEVSCDTHFNLSAYNRIGMENAIRKYSDWYNSVSDIVDFCNKKGIKLVFFVTPEPEWTLVGKGNYQEYHEFIQDMADEERVELYDFNLCRNQYFDMNDGTLFKDEDHLNTKGAEKFSVLFADVVTGRLDSDEVLYHSFDEKIDDEDNPFYGIAGPVDDGNGNRKCMIISGSDYFEYEVVEIKEDGTRIVLKKFDKSRDFIIPSGDTGVLSIVCRNLNTEQVSTIEFAF